MEDGIYKLKCDVKNPHPDKRKTRDWSALVVVEAGTEFIVRTDVMGQEMAPRNERYWALNAVQTDNPDYAELVAALERADDDSLDGILDEHNVTPRDLLDRLLADGWVTERALAGLAVKIRAEDLADRKARIAAREQKIRDEE